MPNGVEAAKAFFDLVDGNEQVMLAVRATNNSIVALAASHGFVFTYDEMQTHLQDRWQVMKSPPDYCCT